MKGAKSWVHAHGAFAVVVALAVAGVGLRTAAAIGSADGYVFSEMTIERDEGIPDAPGAAPDVTVRYSTAWAGHSFPGWRNCMVKVLAQDGSVMGVKRIDLVDLTPEGSDKRTEVPIHGSEAGREPASASGACLPGRIDDPEGRWVFSDVVVVRAAMTTGDLRSFEMTFDDRWVGSGVPGVEACNVTVDDVTGREMFDYPFTFSDAQRVSRDLSMRIVTEDPVVGDPASADVSCRHLR